MPAPWAHPRQARDDGAHSQFPFPDEFRSPNDAWQWTDKVEFLMGYVAFLLLVCCLLMAAPWVGEQLRRGKAFLLRQVDRSRRAGLSEPLLAGERQGAVSVGPKPSYPSSKRVIDLFEERAAASPASIALVLPGAERRELTYAEVAALVQQLADQLAVLGAGRGCVVALLLPRSLAQVIAIFATLKTGAAFLPIDPEAPEARKRAVLQDSEAFCIIAEPSDAESGILASTMGLCLVAISPTDGKVTSHLQGSCGVQHVEGPAEMTDMAMLIYTSGTTGTPKGIIYDNRHLLHGAFFFGAGCEMTSASITLLKSAYFWAVIEWEVFPALINGGTLVVASADGHKSPEYLTRVIREERVDVLMITPQVLDLMLDEHQVRPSLGSLRHIVTVGEALPSALATRAVTTKGLSAAVQNYYGASESSCAVYMVPPNGIDRKLFPSRAPAGFVQPHVEVYIMGTGAADAEELAPVAVGESGEICFGGVMASGYWKRDELTKEKFVDTAKYGRLYRTGDLGRMVDDSMLLEVVGRTDRQVKVRGVRIEPEEVEAVLKSFSVEKAGIDGVEDGGTVQALAHVAVVAGGEPAELAAFVSLRSAVAATTEQLKAHCEANLTPAYVPKHYIILSEFPCLPNGKPNLTELKAQAASVAAESSSVVLDSLGRMKKLSKQAVLENAVIHRCYTYWMLGVLTDHYCRCALDSSASGSLLPMCTALASSSVPPWIEALVRAFGNDQTLFGFIILGTYQDSRPVVAGQRARVKLSITDVFIFVVYLAMALPLPQLLSNIFGKVAWPLDSHFDTTDQWGWGYMHVNSWTSDHRWYLLMVLQARIFMAVCDKLKVSPLTQSLLILLPCLLPGSLFNDGENTFDFCQTTSTTPLWLQYMLSWVFRNFGTGCAIYWRWVHWYVAFYVWCFYGIRPLVESRHVVALVPKGRISASLAFVVSMGIGLTMALFHYPNKVLENGTNMQWVWLELSANIVQPTLFILSMAYLPIDMSWWGNSTLGCYVFHFYFKDSAAIVIEQWMPWFYATDPRGVLQFAAIVGGCVLFATVLGPLGHYALLSPYLLWTRFSAMSGGEIKKNAKHMLNALYNRMCFPVAVTFRAFVKATHCREPTQNNAEPVMLLG